jgi:hypothetical protein
MRALLTCPDYCYWALQFRCSLARCSATFISGLTLNFLDKSRTYINLVTWMSHNLHLSGILPLLMM